MAGASTAYSAPLPRPGSRRGNRWAAIAAILAVTLAGAIAILAVASPAMAVVAIGLGVFAIGVVMRPTIATVVVVFVLYSNAAVIAVRFHDVPFFVAALVPAMLVPPLAAYLVLERKPIVITSAFPWIVGFLLVQLVSGIVSNDVPTSFDTIVTFLSEGIGLYFLLTNVVRTRETIVVLAWVLLLVAGALGALSFYQATTASYDNDFFGFAQPSLATVGTDVTATGEVDQVRLAGNIGEKNRYAQILLMIVPIGLFLAIAERRMWRRVLALGATAATALGVALTFSRGAAVGFVMVAVIMALLGYVRLRYVGLVLLAGVLLLTAVPAYGERLASLVEVSSTVSDAGLSEADGAIQSRITEGLSALLAFADHPIIGVGPGGFPGVYRHYAELVGIRVLAADREAHDLYAGLLAELGLAGGIVFAVIMGLTIRDLLRGRRATAVIDPMMSALCTGFMLSIVTYLTTGIFLHMSFVRYFWMMLALAGAAAVIALAVARQHAALAAEAADDGAPATVAIVPPAVPDGPAGVTARRAPRRPRRPAGSPTQLPQSQSVQP